MAELEAHVHSAEQDRRGEEQAAVLVVIFIQEAEQAELSLQEQAVSADLQKQVLRLEEIQQDLEAGNHKG